MSTPTHMVWPLLLVTGGMASAQPAVPAVFPVVTQFSPVPSGKGWRGEAGPLSEAVLRDTIDNIREHGFTGIEIPTRRPAAEEAFILEYARSKGMLVTAHAGALELFGRDSPPRICVYSSEYAVSVRANAEKRLAPLRDLPGLYNAFTFQDEPFHWGPKSFGYNPEVKHEFEKRYGYELPPDLQSIRNDPRKWLDVINFRSDYFADGWRQVYAVVKEIAPNMIATLTHDSHNTFGAGYGSHAELAIDDVFHWGGDFADLFVFDLYPYMMFDFRFGRPARKPVPRISQTHYCFAQMRNLTGAYKKDLGFWVGTYNPAWFKDYLCAELRAMHWSEREMSTTAVAQGADYLLTGYGIPVDAGHWKSFGEGLRLLGKAGGRLLRAPKVKARACMLFPRTQYIQLQQEYFNVGLSFECFLRAFGELDILHEEQVTDPTLSGYEIVLLFDVELLPEAVAAQLAEFVRLGGTLIADCVPRMGSVKEPMGVLEELFGVRKVSAERIPRSGHWIPRKNGPPRWAYRPADAPDETAVVTERIEGEVLGRQLALTVVSPRSGEVTTADVLAATTSGRPAITHRKAGNGHAYLLGFCLQDTYFQAWEDNDRAARDQLRDLLRAMSLRSGVRPHVFSSNPDIEASVRANNREGFLFVINHESEDADTTIRLRDLDFSIGRIVNLEDGRPAAFSRDDAGAVQLDLSASLGQTLLLHLTPEPIGGGAGASFRLWQLPAQTGTQIMSYVIRTDGGNVIVVDGGMAGDAPYLADFIRKLGGKVRAWFLSHVHLDHVDALREILENPAGIRIDAVYGSVPDRAWFEQVGSDSEKETDRRLRDTLAKTGRTIAELTLGQELFIDGVRFEVLGVKNPEIVANAINNSSLVLRVSGKRSSVLFLGDLGVEGGRKLLEGAYADRLRADYVQMAHHGQHGVEEAVYRRIDPTYCLWPTPRWLWDNDKGGGKGSGPWVTLQVRAWMERLSIKTHYVMSEGLREIRVE